MNYSLQLPHFPNLLVNANRLADVVDLDDDGFNSKSSLFNDISSGCDAKMIDISDEVEDEEKEKEHSSLQERLDMEIKELDKKLEQKEAEMKWFSSVDPSILTLRYEKKVHELEHEKKALQREIEELRCNLDNMASTSDDGTQKLKGEYLQKLNLLESQDIDNIYYETKYRREWCTSKGKPSGCFLFARKFTMPAFFALTCLFWELQNVQRLIYSKTETEMDLITDKENVEEDFGELYAEVEAQANFAITGSAPAHGPPPPPEVVCKSCIEPKEKENSLLQSQTESTRFENGANYSEEDDDDDELNILLNNDDDGEPRSGGYEQKEDDKEEEDDDKQQNECVEFMKNGNSRSSFHYKYLRGDVSSIPAQSDVARVVDGSCRGGVVWENKFTNSVRRRQYGYGFMLPSNRTIMDVDIDMFREKPWRYPEVDLTDYFNFGLNEESWKEYRNSLTCKDGSERCKVSKMEVENITEAAEGRKRPLELPRGRAIRVQSSLCERQSSVDVKCDHIQDSDVIIQITLQEMDEGPSESGKEEHCQKDSDVIFKGGDSHVIDERGVCHCGSANEDEPVGSSKESLGKSSPCRRCSELKSASNQISSDTEKNPDRTIDSSNVFKSIQEKVSLRTSEAIAKAKGGNEASERDGMNAHESDPTITETDLSIGYRSCFSPTASCFGSDSEASKDENFDKPGKVHDADAKLLEPVKPYSGFKMGMRDAKNNFGHRSPILEEQKHHSRRPHDVSEQKLYSEKDDHTFRRRGVKGDREHYGRREIRFHDDWEAYSRRGCNNTKWKVRNGTEHEASLALDAKQLKETDLSRDCSRQNDSWYDFSNDDRSYFREVRRSRKYSIENFANDRFQDVHTRDPFGEVPRGLKDELTPQFKQRWNERVHFSQRRSTLENEDILDRDLKHHGRKSPRFKRRWTEREYYSERCSGIENEDILDKYRGRISPQFKQRWTEREYFSERCSGIGNVDIFERDLKLYAKRFSTRVNIPLHCRKPKNHSFGGRNVDNPQFRKRIDDDSHFLDRRHEDEFVKQKDETFVSCPDREMDRLHGTYQRPSSPIKFSSRGESYGGISHVDEDCKWSMKIGFERRSKTDHKSSSYQLNRGSYKTGGGRTNDTYQFSSTRKYGKGERLVSDRVDMDCGWFGSYDAIDDSANAVDYSYEQDHLDGRRYEYDWHEARHWDDQLYAEEESYSHEKTAMREGIDDKFEATHHGMFKNDYHPDYHKPKILRRSDNHLDKNSDVICRVSELEQNIPRDRGSSGFSVGKGKSAGRCSGRPAKMDRSHAKEKSLNCFNEPHGRRALERVQIGIPINNINKNNEKKFDEFPATESNKDRDIEEGQIITEEPSVNDHLNKKQNSEAVATTRNVKKRISHCESALDENVVVEELDNERILETMAKMEKRRERFKDPVTLKRETETNITLPADFDGTTETKQIRPPRKRRWSGS